MPFDAAGYPEDDGASPGEPTPRPLWLRCLIAVLIFAVEVLLLEPLWRIAHYFEHL